MTNLLGIGLYSIAEAAVLTGVPQPTIRRWIFGREIKNKVYPNLWDSQLKKFNIEGLGFHDLLEIRFVDAFRKHGVSLQTIRTAANHAKELFNSSYPFTCKRFRTDGRSIFATTLDETSDESLIDLVKKQYVFKQVISPSLYKGIEYNQRGDASCWYPLGKNKKIIIDPTRSFGKPIETKTGIPTEALYQAYLAEEDIRLVSSLYEIPLAAVKAAIQFERGLSQGEFLH